MATELTRFEDRVLETVKWCQERKDPPLIWGLEVRKCMKEAGLGTGFPSTELGQVLVSSLCFTNNNPSLWKFIDQSISSGLISSLQILALLTTRVVPHRRTQPEAYRLYLDLLGRYTFMLAPFLADPCRKKIVKSVDEALQLSQTYGVQISELGHALALFLFSIVNGLLYSALVDWGLQPTSMDKPSEIFGVGDNQEMDIDSKGHQNDKRNEHREQLRKTNTFTAVEVLGKLTDNKKAIALLRLIHLNMPEEFNGLLQKLQFMEAHQFVSNSLKPGSQLLVRLSANIKKVLHVQNQLNKRQFIGAVIDIGSSSFSSCGNFGDLQAACWVPFDICMETAMDGKQLPATSAIDVLTELIKTLQVINRASWQETFQAVWVSALRLVQRERDPLEGPVPHLDSRLCVLLSIAPLAIVRVVEDEGYILSSSPFGSNGSGNTGTGNEHGGDGKAVGSRKQGLISSLQVIGQFSGLLSPPTSVIAAANSAAAKAAGFISSLKNVSDSYNCSIRGDSNAKAGGTMLHLIVEACIARKLIDTSAYYWPGYVSAASVSSLSESSLSQGSPWSTFMEGAQLVGPLKNALTTTPASSLVEIEKLYHIALNGSEDDRSAAAKILCGASLSRGWHIQILPSNDVVKHGEYAENWRVLEKLRENMLQSLTILEHVVHFVMKLLSPPAPPNFTGPGSHLIECLPMLHALLFGLSSIDNVHILSLHGVIPEVAASLMPLCEVFGSVVPTAGPKSSTGDEISAYSVFSCAFLFLLRLWKFYRPPHEHCITGSHTGSELTLEYLLILRNSRAASFNTNTIDKTKKVPTPLDTSTQPVYIDSFPKLRSWYCQNKACIASTLSGLGSGNPVHQNANKILNMIYWKITKGGTISGNPSTLSGSSTSGSPASTGEDSYQRPMLPGWEFLEATPFVLEAILTACAYGRLSSRDLITVLRDLVDFLPASLAAIISYFSAEMTRGMWKPVSMNGVDWPSPSANILSIETEVREILAGAGVSVPSCSVGGSAPVMLPLPVAALVSLTITFKLEKGNEYIHGVAGPALENCASGCNWPSMPTIGALWAQKVRRWHDFIVVSCSRSAFKQDQDAVSQLLRSCFNCFLGSPNVASSRRGVHGLLGSGVRGLPLRQPLAPGFLYLRTCRLIHNIQFVNTVFVNLVVDSARESATKLAQNNTPRLKSSQASLAIATSRAKEVAMLGSSLLCVAGGVQLVQLLYQETIPTWLLSSRGERVVVGPMSCILEGYAMAYLVFLSGSFMWGVGAASTTGVFSKWGSIVRAHADFLAGVLEGNISLGCDPATWKAYVSCFVGLMVSFAPAWVKEVKQETLRKLANGLRGWHECELALALLERGGPAAMGFVAELALAMD